MNISSLTPSASLDALLETDTTSTSSSSSTTQTSSAASGSLSTTDELAQELDGPGTSANSPLYKDTVKLLTDLASGNTSAAKSDLAGLQKDLKSHTSNSTTESPLQKLLGSLSTSLDSGNTSAALSTLASYLIQNGSGSGTLVNTTA